MSILFLILSIVFVIGCIFLVIAILMQDKRNAGGVSSIAGMGNIADTYWGKNKARSAEGRLELLTKVGAVALGVLSVILCVV